MSVMVKICGITNRDDLHCAVDAGADLVGFIFAESPRRITPAECAELRKDLPGHVRAVGVFVNESADTVAQYAADCALDYVQLHGNEDPEYCRNFREKALKAFRVKTADDIENIGRYPGSLFLLDSFVPGVAGGTGKTFDHELALEAKKYGDIIIAGGLNVDNVTDVIRTAAPWGVDVSSGVEKEPGIKNHALVKEFIKKAKEENGIS